MINKNYSYNTDLFEELVQKIVGTSKDTSGFPFWNIRRLQGNKYVAEFALAGYGMSDLKVTVDKNVLTVSSAGTSVTFPAADYVWKGFAQRAFSRSFSLKDSVKVTGAEFHNGILSVSIEEVEREKQKPLEINISAPKSSEHPQLLNEDSVI